MLSLFIHIFQLFKNLHGMSEMDAIQFMTMFMNGELPAYNQQRDEAGRVKKLAHLKTKLPELLHKESWEETHACYPCLTDEALHSYLGEYDHFQIHNKDLLLKVLIILKCFFMLCCLSYTCIKAHARKIYTPNPKSMFLII